jgi:hypothetical protein
LGLQSETGRLKPVITMKNQSKIFGPLSCLAVFFVGFAVAASGQTKVDSVVISKNEVRIPPEAKVSAADAKALNDILKTWNKSYYRIDNYSKGKRTATTGMAKLDKTMDPEFAKDAKLIGLSFSTNIIRGMDCSGNGPSMKPGKQSAKSSTEPEPSPSPTIAPCNDVKAKIGSILNKYQKK